MVRRPGPPTRGVAVIAAVTVVLAVALFARPLPGEPTPWEFFRQAAARTDSPGTLFALFFFTIVMMWLNFMAALARLNVGSLLPIIVIALVALPLVSRDVRQSRLVRAGLGLLAVGLIPLVVVGAFVTDNPVGLGFLFAFITPIAGILILCGTILALTTTRPPDIQSR